MNPVLVKEFRQRWRTFKTPLVVSFYLLAMGGMAFFFFFQELRSRGYVPVGESKTLFLLLSLGQMALIAFVAPGLTAGAISGERERQTLNLLLTTQLSPASIIVSKLFTSVSFVFLLIVATLPLYAMVLLYGGVSPLQLFGTFGFFALIVLFCGSFGLLCSVWFKRTSVSTVVAYGCLFVILAGAPFMSVVTEQWFWNPIRYPNHPFMNSLPVLFQGFSPPMMLVQLFEPRPIPSRVTVGEPVDATVPNLWVTDPWPIFLIGMPLLILIFVALSVYLLQPVRPRSTWLKRRRDGKSLL